MDPVEAAKCLAHAWWIDSLLYLLVCAAVIKYALPLARYVMMAYKIANSIMDMMALQSAMANAKTQTFAKPPTLASVPQGEQTSQAAEPLRGVMRRPVVRAMNELHDNK